VSNSGAPRPKPDARRLKQNARDPEHGRGLRGAAYGEAAATWPVVRGTVIGKAVTRPRLVKQETWGLVYHSLRANDYPALAAPVVVPLAGAEILTPCPCR
jgi:hypothetical protein